MQVLIGVDGSPESFAAVKFAAGLLAPERDRITLYFSPPEVRIPSAADVHLVEKARLAVTDAVFDEAKQRLPEALRASAQTIVGTQRPGHGLLVAAEEIRADLIVLGASGAGTVETLLLGSVSQQVLNDAKAPVLVVRDGRNEPHAVPKVLLAYDGAHGSHRLVKVLSRFTWPAGSTASVLSVVDPIVVGDVPDWLVHKVRSPEIEEMTKVWADEHDAEKRARHDEIAAVCRELPPPLNSAKPIIAEGNAAEKILAAARGQHADLLVIGARSMAAWERLLLGSTATRVVTHAPCSVLVVREHETP